MDNLNSKHGIYGILKDGVFFPEEKKEDNHLQKIFDSFEIDKKELVNKIEENYQKYLKLYEIQKMDYRNTCEKILTSKLEELEQGNIGHVQLPSYPQDYSREYVDILEMLKFNKNEVVVLNRQESDRYILNRWSWKDSFLSNFSNSARSGGVQGAQGCQGTPGPKGIPGVSKNEFLSLISDF